MFSTFCRQHEIQIEWRSGDGSAVQEFELISIPPIKSAITYAVVAPSIEGKSRGFTSTDHSARTAH
jgi:hypothetical protein